MSGLLSSAPSASAVRLVVGGYLLMLLQSALLLLGPSLDAHARMLVWAVLPFGIACFAISLSGWPGRNTCERNRHVR